MVIYNGLFVIPVPFVFNCWKHHRLFIKYQIDSLTSDTGLTYSNLREVLLVLGNSQMDMYTGKLFPSEITAKLYSYLISQGISAENDYRNWVSSSGKYRLAQIEEGSKWTFLPGKEDGRYIHIHPAKYSVFSVRIRALELKTAIAVIILTKRNGESPYDVKIVNIARKEVLSESPLKSVSKNAGLGKLIKLLSEEE